MFVIYALVDSRDWLCRYIGMTNDLTERYIAHIRGSEVNAAKNAWILELRSVGLLPRCITLEVCKTEREARESERNWIEAFMQREHPLSNKEQIGRQR